MDVVYYYLYCLLIHLFRTYINRQNFSGDQNSTVIAVISI